MYPYAKRALMIAAIAVATAAPLSGMAAPARVRNERQSPCRLVSAPFAAHKTDYRVSHYVCGGVTYALSDPRLTRGAEASRPRAGGARGEASVR